jgi:hypothetical protein
MKDDKTHHIRHPVGELHAFASLFTHFHPNLLHPLHLELGQRVATLRPGTNFVLVLSTKQKLASWLFVVLEVGARSTGGMARDELSLGKRFNYLLLLVGLLSGRRWGTSSFLPLARRRVIGRGSSTDAIELLVELFTPAGPKGLI